VSDDRATEALEHLQRAALEMIQAARAALDLVEDVVTDPASLLAFAAEVGHLAHAVMTAAAEGGAASSGADFTAGAAAPDGAASDGVVSDGVAPPPGRPHRHPSRRGVERIPVL
jgi:hypothetical protein